MLRNPEVAPVEQGCKIIEEAIQKRFEEIRSGVSEVVEPYVSGLSDDPNDGFDNFARHLIIGIDRSKADQSRALQVARRTFAVSQLVICRTFEVEHMPSFENAEVIARYVDTVQPDEHSMINMYNHLQKSFVQNEGFHKIMKECQPSIDPVVEEPEVFELFGGFTLQSAALGEAKRVRAELETAATELSGFDGDLWELFDESL